MKATQLVCVLLLLVWVCGCDKQPATSAATDNGVTGQTIEGVRAKAENGDLEAQCELSVRYSEGDGMAKDSVEAVKWCRKAAVQNLADAQYALGRFYAKGQGVAKDAVLAMYWYEKAAGQGLSAAKEALARLLDEKRRLARQDTPRQANVQAVTQIVADYHKAHKYLGNDIFVCGDMAKDVWNMVIAKGINAKILVGNVKRDISSIREADHAWVLAEVSPDEWLALETTGGFLVNPEENGKYYYGHTFLTPKEFRDYESLITQFNAVQSSYRGAVDNYNEMVGVYNRADRFTQVGLKLELSRKRGALDQSMTELNRINGELNAVDLRN